MKFQFIIFAKVTLIAIAGFTACTVAVGPTQAEQSQQPPTFSDIETTPFAPKSTPQSTRAMETMIAIPGGTYTLGRNDGPATEQPEHSIELQAFQIDRTEVTNAAFAEYLNALDVPVSTPFEAGKASRNDLPEDSVAVLMEEDRGNGLYPIIALDDAQARIGYSDGAFMVTQGYEDHPVTESTWAGARAYCTWRGADASLYPWGNMAPDDSRVFTSGRTGVTSAVGSRPTGASAFGALDMSGSLAEWTSSLMRPYPYDPDDGRESANQTGERITRGGDYIYDASAVTLTATHRNGFSSASGRTVISVFAVPPTSALSKDRIMTDIAFRPISNRPIAL